MLRKHSIKIEVNDYHYVGPILLSQLKGTSIVYFVIYGNSYLAYIALEIWKLYFLFDNGDIGNKLKHLRYQFIYGLSHK